MNQRKIEEFYRKANTLVFNNALPHNLKITLLNQKREWYGMAFLTVYEGEDTLHDKCLLLSIPTIIDNPAWSGGLSENIKKIVLHEMVHFLQYMFSGVGLYNNLMLPEEEIDWHDISTFNDFGAIAVNHGLISDFDLLTA